MVIFGNSSAGCFNDTLLLLASDSLALRIAAQKPYGSTFWNSSLNQMKLLSKLAK
jgi:hypothetical protein